MIRITIFNNLSPQIVKRHLKRVANDEEKERAERAKQYLNNTNAYSNNTPNVYIYFYEWSTLNGAFQKMFTEYKDFFKFCIDSGIILTDIDRHELYDMSFVYVTCKKGKNELLIADSFSELKNKLENPNSSISQQLPALPSQVQAAYDGYAH